MVSSVIEKDLFEFLEATNLVVYNKGSEVQEYLNLQVKIR